MRGTAWAALLRHIPPEQHDGLMVLTKAGMEITINNMLRIDHEFVAFKGRLAGSQEAGRLFFLPFDNIDYFGYQRPVKDTEYQETFGNLEMPDPAQSAPALLMEPAPPALTPPPARPSTVIKSAVLERFRARGSASSHSASPRPPAEG